MNIFQQGTFVHSLLGERIMFGFTGCVLTPKLKDFHQVFSEKREVCDSMMDRVKISEPTLFQYGHTYGTDVNLKEMMASCGPPHVFYPMTTTGLFKSAGCGMDLSENFLRVAMLYFIFQKKASYDSVVNYILQNPINQRPPKKLIILLAEMLSVSIVIYNKRNNCELIMTEYVPKLQKTNKRLWLMEIESQCDIQYRPILLTRRKEVVVVTTPTTTPFMNQLSFALEQPNYSDGMNKQATEITASGSALVNPEENADQTNDFFPAQTRILGKDTTSVNTFIDKKDTHPQATTSTNQASAPVKATKSSLLDSTEQKRIVVASNSLGESKPVEKRVSARIKARIIAGDSIRENLETRKVNVKCGTSKQLLKRESARLREGRLKPSMTQNDTGGLSRVNDSYMKRSKGLTVCGTYTSNQTATSARQRKKEKKYICGRDDVDGQIGDCKCGYAFTHKPHLKRHLEKKNRKHKCNICGAAFAEKADLRRHEAGVHSAKGIYVCTYCQQIFKWRSSLVKHCKLEHPAVEVVPGQKRGFIEKELNSAADAP